MIPIHAPDASAENLDRLLCLTPDPRRAERVRARCRVRLSRRRPATRANAKTASAWRLLAPAVVGGICVLYVVALMTTTLRLQDLFQ